MKNRFFAIIAFLGFTSVFLSSCSEVPQLEIDAANAAIEQAKTAGADIYVHDNFVALQDSLNGVLVSIESQKSKVIKNYSSAKDDLASVVKFAEEVTVQSETRKAELKAEIEETVAEVNTLIVADRKLVFEAPKGKEGTSALLAIKAEIDAVEVSINETQTLFETGEYLTALDKANVAKEKATSINAELTAVIAKYKAKR